jgi:hypothetical protein
MGNQDPIEESAHVVDLLNELADVMQAVTVSFQHAMKDPSALPVLH